MKNRKRRDYLGILLLLVVGLSVGYALLRTNLTINGTSKIKGNTWDIHFENLNVTDGSVELSTDDVGAAIGSNTTEVSYTVTLSQPGDYYEFTVDAVNAGSIDGMVAGTYTLRGKRTYDYDTSTWLVDESYISPYYETNKEVIKTAFGYATNVSRCGESGTGRSSSFICGVSGLRADAYADGTVYAYDSSGSSCFVSSYGFADCRW